MPSPVVVLVPGFLGSSLSLSIGGVGGVGVWLNPATLLGGLFRRLALPVDDRPLFATGDGFLSPGMPLAAYYGLLHVYLDNHGWDCISAEADFRRPMTEDAARVVALIREKASAAPVRIVCHSRGGLVTRIALGQLAAAGQLGMVARVVGLGVPHVGSLNAVSALSGRAPLIRHIETLSKYGYGFVARLIDPLPVRDVLRSWPALYQLLPDPGRSQLPADALAAIYAPATWGPDTLPPYGPNLTAAAAAWSQIPAVPPLVQWIDIAGFGTQTAVSVPDADAVATGRHWHYSQDGDGTVPVASAAQSPRRKVLTPTQHDMLPNDGRLWPLISTILRDGLLGDITLGGRVLALPG